MSRTRYFCSTLLICKLTLILYFLYIVVESYVGSCLVIESCVGSSQIRILSCRFLLKYEIMHMCFIFSSLGSFVESCSLCALCSFLAIESCALCAYAGSCLVLFCKFSSCDFQF
ncbi:hypothetical protein Dimus_037122 [Dionaea muscipula]